MSTPIKKPCFLAGTPLHSGSVQTGEVNITRGGGRAHTSMSGVTADTLIFSGAGRLNTIQALTQLASGRSAIFYDSCVATSGGPFSASGHKVVGVLPPTQQPAMWSGHITDLDYLKPIQVDMPFQSGLCVGNVSSGTAGWTISFTPEVNVVPGQ
jgi:hypothetical protein